TAPAHAPQRLQAEANSPNGASGLLDQVVEMSDYLKSINSDRAINNQKDLIAAYEKAVRALVGEDDIQRDGGREFKKKSAWKKLAKHFRINVYHGSHMVTRTEDGHTIAECIMIGEAPWGQRVEEIGACTTYEGRFKSAAQRAKGWHDCLATAQTRASNRVISALVAAGEVSAEEVEEGGGKQREDVVGPFPYGPQKGLPVTDGAIGLGLLVKAIRWAMKDEERTAQFEDFIRVAWAAIPSKVAVCPDDELRTSGAWACDPKQEGAFDALAKECADAIHARGLDHEPKPKDATTGTALEGQKQEEAEQLEAKLNPQQGAPEGNAPAPGASTPSGASSTDSSSATQTPSGSTTQKTTPSASGTSTATSSASVVRRPGEDAPIEAWRAYARALLADPSVAQFAGMDVERLDMKKLKGEISVLEAVLGGKSTEARRSEQGRKGQAAMQANKAKRAEAQQASLTDDDEDPLGGDDGDDERTSWDS